MVCARGAILTKIPVVLSAVQSSVGSLNSGLKQVEAEIPLSKEENGDKFVPMMKEFVESKKHILEELNAGVKAAEEVIPSVSSAIGADKPHAQDFKALAQSFGETPDVTPDQFFGALASFITSFEATQKDITRKKEKEAKDAQRKETTPRAKAGLGLPGAAAPDPAAIGDVMNQMKSGSFFR